MIKKERFLGLRLTEPLAEASEYQGTYKPETIDLASLPSIRFLIAWEIGNSDSEKIGKYYDLIWNSDNLSIWRWRELMICPDL